MKEYTVIATYCVREEYYIDAESEEEALEKVEAGDLEPNDRESMDYHTEIQEEEGADED